MPHQITKPLGVPPAGVDKRGASGHLPYLLRQAQAALRAGLDTALSDQGVTSTQFLVLNLLHSYPGASGAEIARVAQVTPQTLNLIVRKLEAADWVVRTDHETNRRVLRMRLTPAGQARLASCKKAAKSVEDRLSALLDPAIERRVRDWLVAISVTFAS